MIKIVAKLTVQENSIEEFHTLARELIEKSRAERGNASYSLNQSTSDPRVHVFIEFWNDQAAIDTHNASAHFTAIFPKLAALCTEPASVELLTEV